MTAGGRSSRRRRHPSTPQLVQSGPTIRRFRNRCRGWAQEPGQGSSREDGEPVSSSRPRRWSEGCDCWRTPNLTRKWPVATGEARERGYLVLAPATPAVDGAQESPRWHLVPSRNSGAPSWAAHPREVTVSEYPESHGWVFECHASGGHPEMAATERSELCNYGSISGSMHDLPLILPKDTRLRPPGQRCEPGERGTGDYYVPRVNTW